MRLVSIIMFVVLFCSVLGSTSIAGTYDKTIPNQCNMIANLRTDRPYEIMADGQRYEIIVENTNVGGCWIKVKGKEIGSNVYLNVTQITYITDLSKR